MLVRWSGCQGGVATAGELCLQLSVSLERTGRSLEGGRPLDPLKKRIVAFAPALPHSNLFSPGLFAEHVTVIPGLPRQTQGDLLRAYLQKCKNCSFDHFAFDPLQRNVRPGPQLASMPCFMLLTWRRDIFVGKRREGKRREEKGKKREQKGKRRKGKRRKGKGQGKDKEGREGGRERERGRERGRGEEGRKEGRKAGRQLERKNGCKSCGRKGPRFS